MSKITTIQFLAILSLVILGRTARGQGLTWCVTSTEEKAACDALVGSAEMQAQISATCVIKTDCEAEMLKGGIDIWSNVDGGSIYEVNLQAGVSIVAGEAYSFSNAVNYYATAVVRASDCTSGKITHLKDLKGKRSCHTGYGKSAGWKTPISKLVANDLMDVVVSDDKDYPNDMASAAEFFDSTCAPMKTNAMATKNKNTLVKNCHSNGCRGDTDACTGSDAYYGYDGAFRCLAEGRGDVAFVKHVTVPRNTEGGENFANTGSWSWQSAADKKSTAWKLICPGSFKCYDPSEYLQCYLSAVPSHAVIAHRSVTAAQLGKLRTGLTNYQATAAAKTLFFNTGSNSKGYVFKSGTKSLVMNDSPELTTSDYLRDAAEIYSSMHLLNTAHVGFYNTSTTTVIKKESSSDNEDALLGAVIGIGVVVAGLIVFVAYMASREKKGKPVFAALV